jgi:hypothetical protein
MHFTDCPHNRSLVPAYRETQKKEALLVLCIPRSIAYARGLFCLIGKGRLLLRQYHRDNLRLI